MMAETQSHESTDRKPSLRNLLGLLLAVKSKKEEEKARKRESLETKRLSDSSDSEKKGLLRPSDEFKLKMKDLPPEALKVYKASGLKESEALSDWPIFVNCLYYSSKALRPKLKEAYNVKKGLANDQNTTGLAPSDTASFPSQLLPDTKKRSSSTGSKPDSGRNSKQDSTSSVEMVPNTQRQTDGQNVHIAEITTSSSYGQQKGSKDHSSKIDSSFDANMVPNSYVKKQRKLYTMEDLATMVQQGNAKDFYTNFHEIGRGSYGKVYTATDKATKKQVAIKHMIKNVEEDVDGIANELKLLDSCHHVNIVNYVTSYMYNKQIWMVMEFCDAGTLRQLLVIEMHEEQIAYIAQQVLRGISYLHGLNRIHRDIKSSNVLLNMNGEVKVADLGLCVEGEGEQYGMAGSKYWMAPEMIRRKPYNTKVDIWSIGALCVEMAEGNPPYYAFKPLKAMFLIATTGAPPLKKDKWSANFKDFLKRCFEMDPSKRDTAEELLLHPFFHKVCTCLEIVKALKLVFLMRVTAGL